MSSSFGIRGGIMVAGNVDFTGAVNATANIVSDGQLMIGAATGQAIRAGFLTSLDSSVNISLGAGTIDLSVSGGSFGVSQLTGNSGTALPSAGNINVVGSGSVNVTGSGSTLTITSSASSLQWLDEASNFTASSFKGYFCTAGLTMLMPPSPSQGDVVSMIADTASAIVLRANTGQRIRIGASISSMAGTATDNGIGNSVTLIFRSADSTWISQGAAQGTFNFT